MTNGTAFNKWENYEVSYHWSLPDDVSIANQTTSVTLPTGLVAADDTTVPLTNQTGQIIGQFTIKVGATTGTLNFTAAAEDAVDRKGTLTLFTKGTTDNETTDNNWTVNKIGWIANKDDAGNPTTLLWNVAFNAGSENLGRITITDALGPNQTYVPGSVTAATGAYDAAGSFVADGGHLTPTVTQNGQTLTFAFSGVTTAVDMTYQSVPRVSPGSQTWTNTASANGQTVTASIPFGGNGSGTGTYGGVVLNKTGTDGVALPGAEFEVLQSDGAVVEAGLTTDANGQISLKKLHAGDYVLVETKAPTGYSLKPIAIPFTITAGATAIEQLYENDQAAATPPAETPVAAGTVALTKTTSTGQVLSGAVYELQNALTGAVLQTGLTTDAAGKLTVTDLAAGDYTLTEVQAPVGYHRNPTPVSFTVPATASGSIQVAQQDVANPPVNGGAGVTPAPATPPENGLVTNPPLPGTSPESTPPQVETLPQPPATGMPSYPGMSDGTDQTPVVTGPQANHPGEAGPSWHPGMGGLPGQPTPSGHGAPAGHLDNPPVTAPGATNGIGASLPANGVSATGPIGNDMGNGIVNGSSTPPTTSSTPVALKLPQTADQPERDLSRVGLSLLLGSLLSWWWRRRFV